MRTVNYCALKDVYIITSMTIVIMVCVWHAVVPAIFFSWGARVANTCDVIVAAALGSTYFVAHIVFAVVITTRVCTTTIHPLVYFKHLFLLKQR